MNVLRIIRNGEVIAERAVVEEEGLVRLPPCTGEEKFEVELEDFSVPAGVPGFFLIPNVRSSSSCGGVIFFRERPDAVEEYNESFAVPDDAQSVHCGFPFQSLRLKPRWRAAS